MCEHTGSVHNVQAHRQIVFIMCKHTGTVFIMCKYTDR